MTQGLAERTIENESETVLLRRFSKSRDESAFAELVRRHGRLVWGVCRRRLARREDAEDAFQATFLILAMKAGTIRRGAALPSWLHRTACRAAVRVASTAPGPPAAETPSRGIDAFAELARYEAAVAVDEELDRLPRRYRDPLVLFHYEELDRKSVADRLGVSETTVKALLARGRELLRTRLARRGVALPLVLPFIADPVPAEAAASACRLGMSLTRGGVSALDLITFPLQGAGPMTTWMTGKTMLAATVGAVCLTLFFTARDPAGAADGDPVIDTKVSDSDGGQAPKRAASGTIRLSGTPNEPPAGAAPDQKDPYFDTPAETAIRRALDQKTELNFPGIPLRQALQFLAETREVKMSIDDRTITAAKVNIDDNVDIVLKDVTLRSGLNLILEPHGLTYLIEDEILKITTKDDAARRIRTVAYDVSALSVPPDAEFAEKLQRLLEPQQPVDPAARPLPLARPVLFGDRLIVNASWSDQERIREILNLLRDDR